MRKKCSAHEFYAYENKKLTKNWSLLFLLQRSDTSGTKAALRLSVWLTAIHCCSSEIWLRVDFPVGPLQKTSYCIYGWTPLLLYTVPVLSLSSPVFNCCLPWQALAQLPQLPLPPLPLPTTSAQPIKYDLQNLSIQPYTGSDTNSYMEWTFLLPF